MYPELTGLEHIPYSGGKYSGVDVHGGSEGMLEKRVAIAATVVLLYDALQRIHLPGHTRQTQTRNDSRFSIDVTIPRVAAPPRSFLPDP